MKMKTIIKENNWMPRGFMDFGWGNGYVLIPQGHLLHGKDYWDIINVDVHGGLTFSKLVDAEMVSIWGLDAEDEGAWYVGFDTAHWGDNLSDWTKESVQAETDRLMEQLINYKG
jgi:hypothetical protein